MQEKIMKWIAIAIILLIAISVPIYAASSFASAPIEFVRSIFKYDKAHFDDIIFILQSSFSNEEIREEIDKVYNDHVEYKGVSIPAHFFVVVQAFLGIEFDEVDHDFIEIIQSLAVEKSDEGYTLVDVDIFADRILSHEKFKDDLDGLSTSELGSIVEGVGSIHVGGIISEDLLNKFKGRLLYPFDSYYPAGSGVGWYSPSGKKEWHNGQDIKAPCGVPTYAMDDGIVTMVGRYDHWRGNYIFWENDTTEYRYLHFREALTFRVGDRIEKGMYIGNVGNTGYSFGCHLHLEIRENGNVLDPAQLINFDDPFLE